MSRPASSREYPTTPNDDFETPTSSLLKPEILISSPRGRKKFLDELYHFAFFDPRYVVEFPFHLHHGLVSELRRRGAGDLFYAISVDPKVDGTIRPLEGTIDFVFQQRGLTYPVGILCCIPRVLAYYEGERDYYILDRRTHVGSD